MREYKNALTLIVREPTVHAPIEQIKARIDRLERIRDKGELNSTCERLISRAIITTSIDLGRAYESRAFAKPQAR